MSTHTTPPATLDAVTTAHLAPAAAEPLLDEVSVSVLAHRPDVVPSWELTELPGGLSMLHVRAEDAPVEIRLSVPLGDAAGYWHPQAVWRRTLLADWAGRGEVCLVNGPGAGCLYEHSGATMLTFALADPVPEATLRFGVSEENDTFVVHLRLPGSAGPHQLLLVPRAPSVAAAMRPLRDWSALAFPPMPVPDSARQPVYSTWYAFNQEVSAEAVETQAELSAELGCGALILDDGWQLLGNGRGYAGCGDWLPDPAKFPDFAGHVARVRDHGLSYVVWVAPLLIGPEADCYGEWARFAPVDATVPGARVLDPRRPEVRQHVIDLCVSLVRDYGLDGLKLDFLDEASVYAGDGGGDVGRAMSELLAALRRELESVRAELLLELRQPYNGLAMTQFGNMLRANDCPADAVANRVRTLDTGLLAAGGVVHADMVMWARSASVATVARQLISTLHSVPQFSVRLDQVPAEHLAAIRFWLGVWRRHRELLLDGEVEPGRPDELYPLVRAASGDECLISVHADRVVELDLTTHRRVHLVNGSDRDRVMVEFTGGAATVSARVHGPDGRIMGDPLTFLSQGVRPLAVPRGGLVLLTEGSR